MVQSVYILERKKNINSSYVVSNDTKQHEQLRKRQEELTASLDSLSERDPETIRKLSNCCCF